MERRVKLFGHPIHPMLIVFPLGLFATAVIFDILHLITGSAALVFSFAGVVLFLITAWIGSELVYRLSVAVDPGANVNAASSLTEPHVLSSPPKMKESRR